jgi:hypothetical protein
MKDVEVVLRDVPGALGELGRVLGGAGISLEGGGVFAAGGPGSAERTGNAVAHFLVEDGERARKALEAAGIGPVTVQDVVSLRLDQQMPGSLGLVAQRFGNAGINIRTQYSDHDGRLILVVDPAHQQIATGLAAAWIRQR